MQSTFQPFEKSSLLPLRSTESTAYLSVPCPPILRSTILSPCYQNSTISSGIICSRFSTSASALALASFKKSPWCIKAPDSVMCTRTKSLLIAFTTDPSLNAFTSSSFELNALPDCVQKTSVLEKFSTLVILSLSREGIPSGSVIFLTRYWPSTCSFMT